MPQEKKQRYRETRFVGATRTDPETGEVTDMGDFTALQPITPSRRKTRREIKFMMVDIEAMPRLRMSKGEWSLFWQLVSYVDRERGEARVSTKELSKQLGATASNVSRTLSRLQQRGILLRLEVGVWRISPRLMSRKAVEQWALDMEKAPLIDWDGES